VVTADTDGLVRGLVERIDEVLGPLVSGRRCALVGFPAHPNPGDSAIWVGEREALRRAGSRVAYACDEATYEPGALRTRLGDGVVLLHGGGNLGDLWPEPELFRERVIADFPELPVVQLPQTVSFRERSSLERAKSVLGRHPDLTLLVRDGKSLEFARRELGGTAILCPDTAFGAGPLVRSRAPTGDILWLARTDSETSGDGVIQAAGVELADWRHELPAAVRKVKSILGPRLRRSQWLRERLSGPVSKSFDSVARHRLAYAVDLLSGSRVLITDRLHGHVLALLLGIPHVLLGDRYGKVRAFHETWTSESGLATWANSPEEALAEARNLLGRAT
jgi:exopolysaccharide biosynthesis predicted pyruvyltransferase EpsI